MSENIILSIFNYKFSNYISSKGDLIFRIAYSVTCVYPIAICTVVFELLCPDNSCNLKSDSYREFVFFPIGQVVFVFVKEETGCIALF